MSLLKDFARWELDVRKRYWFGRILNPRNWYENIKYRHQRAERGWSDRDTWGGGEHVASVAAGILHQLNVEKNPIDWEYYFQENFGEFNGFGYKSLDEVADDIDLYLYWQENNHLDEFNNIPTDDYWAIEHQLYEQLLNAMMFVATNIGRLWW